MSEEEQVSAEMAVHSLETAIADIERLTLSAKVGALKADEARLFECLHRLWNVTILLQPTKVAA